MTITDVKQQIKDKKLDSYYIFTGEEIEIQRIYVEKIAEVLNYEIVRPDSVADVWNSIVTPTLFDAPCVYVVRDDKDLLRDEKLQDKLNKINFNGNILIHLVTNVDKRTKFYKANSSKIVLFERLTTEMLKKYASKLITLTGANFERLVTICENDYSRMLLEIDKIKRFAVSSAEKDYNKIFEQFVSDGTIYIPPKDAIFDLVDAILCRKPKLVYNLLQQCYAVGEANMVILNVLYTNTKQVLQVQACESSDISKSTGLTAWQVKCAKAKAGNYSIGELVDILRLIQELQKGIITGQIEDSLSVEYLLVNIL